MNTQDPTATTIDLEELLEDVVFVQFLNAFLSLHVFEVRLLYNAITRKFEEFNSQLVRENVGGVKSHTDQRSGNSLFFS